MNSMTEAIVTIATAIVGVAILSVLVSKNANTAVVLGAAGGAFSNALSAATGPVTGKSAAPINSAGGGALGGMFNLGSVTMPQMTNFA